VWWRRVHGLDANPATWDCQIAEIRHDEWRRYEQRQRRPMRHDAFEPSHVPLVVAGEFSVVVVVRGEMLMNGRMRVVCVRVVPMLLG
jgi:hypothetical protein